MKNTILWASLALSTLVAILPLASCQKENFAKDQSITQTITRTISADVEAILPPKDDSAAAQESGAVTSPETKSVYEAGVGVHLTNNEYMSVFYASNNGDKPLPQ